MRRNYPAGMGVQRGPVIRRPPVELPPCRGCGVPYADERVGVGELRGHLVCLCLVCGIDDPVGIGRPRKAHAADCTSGAGCACPWPEGDHA